MQNFSLHMHTAGFDGRNTEEEMLQKAQQLGIKKIGFSNHFIVHPNIKSAPMYKHAVKGGYAAIYSSDFDEVIAKFIPHYAKIDELQEKYQIKIYKGMEVDFFNNAEWKKGFTEALIMLKPDYLIGSAHFIEYKNTLYNSHDLQQAIPSEQNLLLHKYWQNLRAAAKSGIFNFMAHLDLMKKVGLGFDDIWQQDEQQTIDVIKKAGIAVELNTSYYKFGKDEPYPGRRIMSMLSAQNIPVFLSDDAHKTEQLGWYFEQANALAEQYNLTMIQSPQEVLLRGNYKKNKITSYERE